jgi:hypothetical protein
VKMSLRAKKQAGYSRSVLNGVGELRKPTPGDAGRRVLNQNVMDKNIVK